MRYKRPLKRKVPGTMNKLEQKWADHLSSLKRSGEIEGWRYEAIKFKLADNTFYNPDFVVTYPGHIEIHETKGFRREDAMVKIKVAAALYHEFRFLLIEWKDKQWKFTEY